MLACIPGLIAESFNQRIDLGLRREEPSAILSLEEQLYWASTPNEYEEVPVWTEKVPPLKEMLHIPHSQPHVRIPSSWSLWRMRMRIRILGRRIFWLLGRIFILFRLGCGKLSGGIPKTQVCLPLKAAGSLLKY